MSKRKFEIVSQQAFDWPCDGIWDFGGYLRLVVVRDTQTGAEYIFVYDRGGLGGITQRTKGGE